MQHSTEEDSSGTNQNIYNVGGTIDMISGNTVRIQSDDENLNLLNIDIIVFCTGYKYDFPFLTSLKDLDFE